ncbi:MAG: PCMD domain-containing protein, partial [Bacteroidales bacterium]
TISITKGSVVNEEVVCKLANVKVSVEIDPSVNESFKDYKVVVSNTDKNNGLIFSSTDHTITNAGYFACTGKLNWSLYLVNNNDILFDGDVNGAINNVKPREHYIIKVKVSNGGGADGASNITIVVDDSVNEQEHHFDISLNKKEKPKYSGAGFNLENEQLVPEGTTIPYQINVDAKAGISKMIVKHTSLAMANAGIPYSFNLLEVTALEKSTIHAAGLTWNDVAEGAENMVLSFTNIISKLPLGTYGFDFMATDKQYQAVGAKFRFRVIPGVETTSLNVEPWAKQAFLYGMWNTLEKPAGLGMEYKKVSESSWTQITGGFTFEGSKYSMKITNLEPSTNYVMRTFSAKEISNEIEFTTEAADQIPNMSFDKWYKEGKHWYANENSSKFWWDSGNVGANTLSEVNPTSPESSIVAVAGAGKQAVRMESKTVFGILAAGNVYLGKFGKTIGTSGAQISFGRPYTCRPLSLKGYYSYAPKTINKTKAPYDHLSGQSDMCQIYVLLTDKGSMYAVDTSEKTFIDIQNDPTIIAYGEKTTNSNTNGYQMFDIPLVYRSNRKPTHCVIVASASKYGDYFTGGVGSLLYIDELEFTF